MLNVHQTEKHKTIYSSVLEINVRWPANKDIGMVQAASISVISFV